MTIDQEFNCLGYFGFGSGVSATRKQGAYCNGCHMAKACWEIHRARCQQIVPNACEHIDQLSAEKDGQKKIMEFIKEHKTEPYSAIMMGNMEDAISIIHTGKPKDREKFTLPYPFKALL